jgi:hypothetical protein
MMELALADINSFSSQAVSPSENTIVAAFRAIQDAIKGTIDQLKTANLMTGREAAILAEKAARKLQGAWGEEDTNACFARAAACIKWTVAEGLKAARRSQPTEDLPMPRTKTDLSALTILATLKEEAKAGKKLISMTSTQARALLSGRWGGLRISRKVCRDVLRRAVALCPVVQLGHVPGDLRGTLQLTVKGSELLGSEVIDWPYRYRQQRPGGREGDGSTSILARMGKSIYEDDCVREDRCLEVLSNNDYTISKEGRGRT